MFFFLHNGHTHSFFSSQPCRRGAHRSDGLQESLTPQSKRHVYAGREYFSSDDGGLDWAKGGGTPHTEGKGADR